jgi:hypothetical protein
MNRSTRRRLALRVLAAVIGVSAIGIGGIAFAGDSGTSVTPGQTVIAPAGDANLTRYAVPADSSWT